MSRRGNCWDNAPQESFFGHMKDELAPYIPSWKTFEDVKARIDDWMVLWSSVFVTLVAKKYRFMQFELDMVFDTR